MNAAMLEEQKNQQTNKLKRDIIKCWSVPTSPDILVVLKILPTSNSSPSLHATGVHHHHHHHHHHYHYHHHYHHHAQGSDRASKVQLHWILNLFSIVAAAGGFGAIYLNKEVIIIIILIIMNIIIII